MPSTILSDNGASSGSAGLKSTAGNDGVLILQTTTSGGTATNAVTINTLQNVGIVATQSTWDSGYKALEIAQGVALWGATTTNFTTLTNNVLYDGAYKYKNNGYANQYVLGSNGSHTFYNAGSGSAGGALTLTQTLLWNKDNTLALQGASSTAGTGIAFPATQSASSDANTLDDYEEGTFTPTFTTDGTNFTSVSYQDNYGSYTKIGNVVTVRVRLRTNGLLVGSASGSLLIGNLPFSAIQDGNGSAAAIAGCSGFTTNQPINLEAYQQVMYLYYRSTSNGATQAMTAAMLSNNAFIVLTGTYRVT